MVDAEVAWLGCVVEDIEPAVVPGINVPRIEIMRDATREMKSYSWKKDLEEYAPEIIEVVTVETIC